MMNTNLILSQAMWHLLPALANCVQKYYRLYYKREWWTQVRATLHDQIDTLPYSGEVEALTGSLDISACIKLIDRNWSPVFNKCDPLLRSYVKELQSIRNAIAHIGTSQYPIVDALRALDTMQRIAGFFDNNARDNIRALHVAMSREYIESRPNEEAKDAFPDWRQVASIGHVKSLVTAFAKVVAAFVFVVEVYSVDFLNFTIYYTTDRTTVDSARAQEWFDTCRDYFSDYYLHFVQIKKSNGMYLTTEQAKAVKKVLFNRNNQ